MQYPALTPAEGAVSVSLWKPLCVNTAFNSTHSAISKHGATAAVDNEFKYEERAIVQ